MRAEVIDASKPPATERPANSARPPNPEAADAGHNGAHGPRPPTEAFHQLGRQIGELKEYFGYYLAAKSDGIKMSIRNAGLYAGLGIVGLIAGAGIIVTAAVLLLTGLAGGLGALFGHRYWLGNLIVGLLVLGGLALAIMLVMKKLTNSFRQSTVQKYEQRQNWQRGQYGRAVPEAASQSKK